MTADKKISELESWLPIWTSIIPYVNIWDDTNYYWLKSDFNWEDAPEVQIIYSIDWTTLWHTPFVVWDFYIRFSTDWGTTWSDWKKYVWEDWTIWEDWRSIVSIIRTSWDWSAWTTDTYTITYDKAPLTSTFNVYNWADWNIQSIVWWTNIDVDSTDSANPIVNLIDEPEVDSLIIDSTASSIWEAWKLRYKDDIVTVVLDTDETDVSMPIVWGFKVKNTSGVTINQLYVVYPTWATWDNPTVELADANDFDKSRPVWLIRSPTIANNWVGYVALDNRICNCDTSAWAEWDKLYLSTTPWLPTNVKPASPAYPIMVWVVVRSNITQWIVIVDIWEEINANQDLSVWSSPTFIWTNITKIPNSWVDMNSLNITPNRTLRDFINVVQSSWYFNDTEFIDNWDGTLKVTAWQWAIRATNVLWADLLAFEWAENASMILTDNATNYIYIDYNAWTPLLMASTTKPTNYRTYVVLWKVYKEWLNLHKFKAWMHIPELWNNVLNRFVQQFWETTRTAWAIISETWTLNLAVSDWLLWGWLTPVPTTWYDTSISWTFEYYYYNWTTWIETDATQINNTQYNNITTWLTDLISQQYWIHWTYIDADWHIMVVYWQDSYSLLWAEQAQPPSSLPNHITEFAFLSAKVIIKKTETIFTEIQSAYDITFTSSVAWVHNDLAWLQWWTADEYYHLTADELWVVQNTSWTNTWDETTTTIWTLINWADAKTTPVDADLVPIRDTTGWLLEKVTWANIKATLKTYFDSIYVIVWWALWTPSSWTLTNTTWLPEWWLSLTDITTNNASTTKHWFLPKLSNVSTEFLDWTGAFSTPAWWGWSTNFKYPHSKSWLTPFAFSVDSTTTYTPPSWKVAYITASWNNTTSEFKMNWINIWDFRYNSTEDYRLKIDNPIIIWDTDTIKLDNATNWYIAWFLVDENIDIEPISDSWTYTVPSLKQYVITNIRSTWVTFRQQFTIWWVAYYWKDVYNNSSNRSWTVEVLILNAWDTIDNAFINHHWYLVPTWFIT